MTVRTVVLLLALGLTTATIAQNTPVESDVVFLKNGQAVVGRILELKPDSFVRIVAANGVSQTFSMSEVDRIEKWQKSGSSPVAPGVTKKEPCLGCLFSWVIPGSGMLYAEDYAWAAVYFCVNTPLMVWATVENLRGLNQPGYEFNWTPLVLLMPLRLIEYGHTLAVIDSRNKKAGFTLNLTQPGTLASLEYGLPSARALNDPRIELVSSADGRTVRLGLKAGL